MAIPGAVDGAAFAAYAERVLAPSLRPGQVVVLDNLSAHKSDGARTAVEAAGARLLFLPAYSPDFNPIELAFAKVKERLRAAAERTPEGRRHRCRSTTDAHRFFAHCGFPLPADSYDPRSKGLPFLASWAAGADREGPRGDGSLEVGEQSGQVARDATDLGEDQAVILCPRPNQLQLRQ